MTQATLRKQHPLSADIQATVKAAGAYVMYGEQADKLTPDMALAIVLYAEHLEKIVCGLVNEINTCPVKVTRWKGGLLVDVRRLYPFLTEGRKSQC